MKTQEVLNRTQKLISNNRRALHDYLVMQSLEAGIALTGTEVKSLRSGKCSLQDAYCGFPKKDSSEMFIFNLHISPYAHGNRENHEPKRPRKLLVHLREALKLRTQVQEKGLTIVPTSIYFSGHLVKLEIALVRAKRKYDKREAVKERETDREIQRKFRF